MMDTFSIKELILKGKQAVREYEIPNIGKVYVRPLTDLEISRGEVAMMDLITDSKTRAYALGKNDDADDVDFTAIAEAGVRANALIAFMAMEDFADGEFTMELVEQLPGINALATFVREISGVQTTKEASITAAAAMKDFREE